MECSFSNGTFPNFNFPTGAKVFQISIYILVFIASCRRGKFAPSTPRGTSAISHGGNPKMKFNCVKTHLVKRLVRSHFSSRRAPLHQNSPIQPLFPSPRPLIRREDKNNRNNKTSITARQLVLSAGESNAGLSQSPLIKYSRHVARVSFNISFWNPYHVSGL